VVRRKREGRTGEKKKTAELLGSGKGPVTFKTEGKGKKPRPHPRAQRQRREKEGFLVEKGRQAR